MTKKGTYIGYDPNGNPVAAAIYGKHGETRNSAKSFCSSGELYAREFDQDDPELKIEIARWQAYAESLPI